MIKRSEMIRDVVEKVLKGTTTVGIATRDFVILAADKRASAGIYVAHRNVKKIEIIDERTAMTIAGLVADAQILADYIRAENRLHYVRTGKRMSLRAMASLLSLLLNESKYFPYIVQLLLGGIDIDERPRLFQINIFGDLTEERYVATGSGSPTAIGILENAYSEDMDLDKAVELARQAVVAAVKRDVFTGEGVDVVAITKSGVKSFYFSIA
ncbi:MAG: archaeal proteasome endopeptidase complex subunit beta [Desulfurococcales archaeon]|jgi:proteasome beta subunit|nr:archaeal proteasome endopeptidase complex subunit beta [Desulfurococcales archaeon]